MMRKPSSSSSVKADVFVHHTSSWVGEARGKKYQPVPWNKIHADEMKLKHPEVEKNYT